jgi:flagellar basal body rod protein FlgB
MHMAHDLTTEAIRLAMGMQQLRAENASRNIALANTPGAQATRLDFGSSQGLLEQAATLSMQGADGLVETLETAGSRSAVSESLDASGTGIHLDDEVADMAGANLQYQALAESLSRHFGLMRLAITGRN